MRFSASFYRVNFVVVEYLTLNNGIRMPMVGLGTWDMRGRKGLYSILTALECGYRLIDTAQMYKNEDIVGKAILESGLPRKDVFLTTKLYRNRNGYQEIKHAVEKSLDDLCSDYVDLFLIHEPYANALELYEVLKEFYRAGKIRAIGISNFHEKEYQAFIRECGIIPAIDQVESHVYFPRLNLQKLLQENGTKMQSWGSFTEGRIDIFNEPVLKSIAAKQGKTASQIALRFLLQKGIAVIPKSVHKERLMNNFSLFDFRLTDKEMEEIAALNQNKSLFGWY